MGQKTIPQPKTQIKIALIPLSTTTQKFSFKDFFLKKKLFIRFEIIEKLN